MSSPINEQQLQEVVDRLRQEPEHLRAVHCGMGSIPSKDDFTSPAGSNMTYQEYAQRRCQKYIVHCPTCTCRHAQSYNPKDWRAPVPMRPDELAADPNQPSTSGTAPSTSSGGQSGRGKKKRIGAGALKKKQDRRWTYCFAQMDAHRKDFSASIPSQAEIAAHLAATADDFEAADVAVNDDDETHDFSSSPTHEAISFWDGEDMQQQ